MMIKIMHDLITRVEVRIANLFPLSYRMKYFMLNLVHRLIHSGQLDLNVPQRETRQNIAPLFYMYVPMNDTVAKTQMYTAKDYWNNLAPTHRSIQDYNLFKTTMKREITNEFIRNETARLTAGLFCWSLLYLLLECLNQCLNHCLFCWNIRL